MYPEQAQAVSVTGGIYTEFDRAESERLVLLKQLDEQFAKTDAAIDRLTQRITPALRVSDATIADIAERAGMIGRADSDVVAHLRHTVSRVRDLADRIGTLAERVDL